MMKRAAAIATLLLGCSSNFSNALIANSGSRSTSLATISFESSTTALASSNEKQGNDDDVLYSFGAEVVPEGQRPVNEYLDMKRAPLFGWGSNDVGLDGLLIRLGIVYAVIFLLV